MKERVGTTPVTSYTRGSDLSGTLEGAGGIGGLLARSHGYSSGNWSTHNFYHADGNGSPREINTEARRRRSSGQDDPLQPLDTAALSHGEIVTYLVDGSQGMAASYRYDPYGNLISSSGSLASANVYRFSSKAFHADSGMYYYGYRWYDPNLQRWLNRDPLGENGGINLYGFVGNKAVLSYDALGLQPNGCGTAGAIGGFPPDGGILWNFGPACDSHDLCYEGCGANRAACDRAFFRDMISICRAYRYQPGIVYEACMAQASTYYFFVRLFGGTAFRNAQAASTCGCNRPHP